MGIAGEAGVPGQPEGCPPLPCPPRAFPRGSTAAGGRFRCLIPSPCPGAALLPGPVPAQPGAGGRGSNPAECPAAAAGRDPLGDESAGPQPGQEGPQPRLQPGPGGARGVRKAQSNAGDGGRRGRLRAGGMEQGCHQLPCSASRAPRALPRGLPHFGRPQGRMGLLGCSKGPWPPTPS